VTLKAGERQSVPFEINTSQLELKPGPHQVEVRHATVDPMPFNNVRFATFTILEGRQVLVITDDTTRQNYWELAVNSKEGFRCKSISTKDAARLDADALSSYAVVTLFCVAHPEPLWKLLGEYVQSGGGLIVVPGGNEISKDDYNSTEAAKLLPGRLVGYEMLKGEKGLFWDFQETVYQHPILKPWGEWRLDKNIELIQAPRWTNQFWEIDYDKAKARAIINYAEKKSRPALLERQFDAKEGRAGKVLLFTTPMDGGRRPPANNFLESPSFYPVIAFYSNNFLAGDPASLNLNFITGQSPPMVQLPRGPRAGVYVVHGPGVMDNVSPETQGELRFRELAKPGNYLVKPHNEEEVVGAFSLNLPAEECSAVRVPAEEIAALFGSDAVVPVDRRAKLRDALKGHLSEPEELLPLLMIVLLLVLAVENLLANKFYRREPDPQANP
jgi:hypothetical protein